MIINDSCFGLINLNSLILAGEDNDVMENNIADATETIEEVDYVKGELEIIVEQDGIYPITIDSDTTFGKVTCSKEDQVYLDKDKNLRGCVLAKEYKGFMKKSELLFYKDQSVWSAVAPKKITIPPYEIEPDSLVEFHNNGKIKSFTLGTQKEIQGYLFEAGTVVWLDEEGLLNYVYLAKKQTLQNYAYAKETYVWFYKNGNVKEGTLAIDHYPGSNKLSRDSIVMFYDNKSIIGIILGEDQWYNNMFFYAKTRLEFLKDGHMIMAALSNNTIINETNYLAKWNIYFDDDLIVDHIYMKTSSTYNEALYPDDTDLWVDKSGKPTCAWIGDSWKIEDDEYSQDSYVYFNDDIYASGAFLGEEQYVRGFKALAFSLVEYYDSGELMTVKIAEADKEWNDLPLHLGMELFFQDGGDLVMMWLEQNVTYNGQEYSGGTYLCVNSDLSVEECL